MNKKIKIEIAVGIILIIALVIGGFVWLSENKFSTEKNNISDIALKQNDTNLIKSDFGFEFNIPKGWRLATGISAFADAQNKIVYKYIDEVSDNWTADDYINSEKKHLPERNQMINSWTSENREHIILTTLSINEEKEILSDTEKLMDLGPSQNNTISIVVDDLSPLEATDIKEKNDDKSIIRKITLNDGSIVRYSNLKGTLKIRRIEISLNTQKALFNGKIAKKITLEIGEGAMPENEFINFAKNITISK
jgi:hypothetical protein